MGTTYEKLFEFIATAERNRKYPANTATSYRTALRLVEDELNEQEKESLETFQKNLEQIFHSYYTKHPTQMSAASLEEYKRRVKRILGDFENYGTDPGKMASWNREVIKRKPRKNLKAEIIVPTEVNSPEQEELFLVRNSEQIAMTRFELPLRPAVKAIILTPSDLTGEDVKKIRSYIDFLDSIAKG